ncbi:hypothetical protein [Actinomadura sp. 6N118]|uniref:hypothetical protein n=1 Tax=Actinomadura sp. 6N118 TaxID=3375151 RepID=UPI003794AED3
MPALAGLLITVAALYFAFCLPGLQANEADHAEGLVTPVAAGTVVSAFHVHGDTTLIHVAATDGNTSPLHTESAHGLPHGHPAGCDASVVLRAAELGGWLAFLLAALSRLFLWRSANTPLAVVRHAFERDGRPPSIISGIALLNLLCLARL